MRFQFDLERDRPRFGGHVAEEIGHARGAAFQLVDAVRVKIANGLVNDVAIKKPSVAERARKLDEQRIAERVFDAPHVRGLGRALRTPRRFGRVLASGFGKSRSFFTSP
ncbi:MAG TPA: hypothetical protein VGH28_10455 [Polyangiaceae bacterium]